MLEVRRGEIWLGKLNGNGSVQKGTRPGIIVSNAANNKYSPVVNFIPLTSETMKNNIPVHVEVGYECGLHKKSIALVEQETTVDKRDLTKKVGECTNEVLKEIEKAILIQKGIIKPFIDMQYVNRIKSEINFITEIINKCKKRKLDYDNDLREQILLIADLKHYCSQYNIDYRRFVNIDFNYKRERLQGVL